MCIHVCIKRCLKSRVSRSHQRAGGINVACYPYLNSPQAASNHIKQQQHSRLFWHVLPTKLDNRIFIQKKVFFKYSRIPCLVHISSHTWSVAYNRPANHSIPIATKTKNMKANAMKMCNEWKKVTATTRSNKNNNTKHTWPSLS